MLFYNSRSVNRSGSSEAKLRVLLRYLFVEAETEAGVYLRLARRTNK